MLQSNVVPRMSCHFTDREHGHRQSVKAATGTQSLIRGGGLEELLARRLSVPSAAASREAAEQDGGWLRGKLSVDGLWRFQEVIGSGMLPSRPSVI